MRRFSQSLLEEMEQQLKAIHAQTRDPVRYAEQAIKLLVTILEQLKTFSVKYKFVDVNEEIEFFRDIKPRFACRLLYYNDVYNIEVSKPLGQEKGMRKYYKSELAKLKSFFDDNLEFYRYYRTGDRELDGRYFVRRRFDLRPTLDSAYFQADHRFSTSHDFKVARIMANDMTRIYLEERLATTNDRQPSGSGNGPKLNWTAPKVALVELIYALHAGGVFNNNSSDLKEIVTSFEELFNVSLGQYHKTFLEIRERKSERAKFLGELRDRLIVRMEQADEM